MVGRLLVHVTVGPEQATRATLAMLVARTALAEGHDVDVFIAGDAVQLLREETLDGLHGLGTGHLREHVDALRAGGARLYASGMSAKARGLGGETLGALGIQASPPDVLVRLAFEADRVLTY